MVINYDFPNSMITYIHRVGRTGRAARRGKAVTFFTDQDAQLLRSVGNVLKISGCDVPDWVLEMPKIEKEKRKRLERIPLKREAITTEMGVNVDKSFEKEMKIKDKIYLKKLKKAGVEPKQMKVIPYI